MNSVTKRVVVGVDGSSASNDALAWAVDYAALVGAQVEAVTSWSMPTAYGVDFATVDIDWAENARETMQIALDQVLPGGSDAVIRTVVENHPSPALLHAAEAADLLVVGSRGHGGFAGMVLGSVSEHVVAHSPCPVVVVRHQATP